MAEETNNLFAVQEDNEQTATEQNAEVAEETTTEQTEEELAEGEESEPETEQPLTDFQQKILADLNRRIAEGDAALATAMQSKDKSIADCTNYLNERAKQLIEEKARQGAVCIQVDDPVVYGWAHHYYIESKETIEQEIPAMKPYVAPKPAPKTAEQKKQEEQTKKVYANPLLAALMKKGGKIATDGTIAVTKTTERKDKDGNLLFSKAVKTDAQGTKTTTIEKGGKTYTMTEFSLF